MSINKPFKRTVRQFTEKAKKQGGLWYYIMHKDFANLPEHYIRAYLIIQKDFLSLLDYIEPADKNLGTYSFRIHELLLRICIEIEANCVAILSENGYTKKGNWNMSDYKKINESHKLSFYQIKLPVWKGEENLRQPFKNWEFGKSLEWWEAYNKSKHDRHNEFDKATFENLTNAICALIAILSSQFQNNEFSSVDKGLSIGVGPNDGMESTIGGYFRVKYPNNWSESEKYGFTYSDIEKGENPIGKYEYQ
ncbi:hypothetical protein [uncultured Polaribacter sp.]|uniref:hypothetical protein n=1 Tax=uncultured Polaribacter sp. TaxID=174711 RepID=UPI002636E95F|nr:hypothetical protein [uncultured Polaribacter sp.]